ncbi:unnamed protein product [Durusdinium trenchii]|uniref:SPX domain-containing protein n=1 Tax=Durusdinium trenchii TaxID=1381693 RepID=A0ABP0T295_9DINO
MKFAKLLDEYQLAEWRGTYIPYYFLKKRLNEIATSRLQDALRELSRRSTPSSQGGRRLSAPVTSFEVAEATGSPDLHTQDVAREAWLGALKREVRRVDSNVNRGLQELQQQFLDLMQLSQGEGAEAQHNPMSQFLHLNMLEALGRLGEGIYRLKGYTELNHAALYKILRKWDKVLKRTDGVAEIYPQIIEGTRIGDMTAIEALDANVKEAFSRQSPATNPDISPEVALLAAGLGTRSAGLQGQALRAERLLFFFLGSSSALVLSIIALICLPEKDPMTFSKNYFLCSFPVFRVCLSAVLVILGLAYVARVCEDNFINHFFILGIDPRCRVSPNFLFTWAMLLSSAWILVFGFYVVDYKWMVLPLVWASSTRLERASWHYVLYPTVLLGLTVALLLRPSAVCRCKYKVQILRGVGRTCLAPFYAVNFGDNMVGDVLTSLARPLRDVPAAMCYLGSHHPQLQSAMEQFVKSGNTCPAWEHEIISPLIAALPFWFRLWQCARRFWDTGQKRNLLNLGKYTSSLIVVIVSTQACPKWLVVLASAVATAYAAWWDICMDWGLTFGDLCFLTGARRSSGAGGTSHSSPASSFDAGLNSPVPGSPVQSFAGMNVRMGPGRQAVGQYSRAQSGT